MTGKRIILASLGSAGDLHPYLAIARGLNARGYAAAVGCHPYMQYNVESAGVDFVPVRPDVVTTSRFRMAEHFFHPTWGDVRIRRQLMLPNLGATVEDLKTAVRDADLLITSPTILPAALVAAKTGIPWISTFHTPTLFGSLAERAAANLLPRFGRWRWVGAMAHPLVAKLMRPAVFSAEFPLSQLWRQHGLVYSADRGPDNLYAAKLVLGLFSSAFAPREPRWPSQTRITGFPLYDGILAGTTREGALEKFLAEGDAPLVFALGSTSHEQHFHRDSLEAAVRLKRRALFLIGNHRRDVLPDSLPAGMMVAGQVPYSTVFPRGAVNIHHGGIGTTALAMKAGRPMLVVPRAFDQLDNAARAERVGVGHAIHRSKYNAARATTVLRRLLDDDGYAVRAKALGARIQAEDGVREACDVIEEFLRAQPGVPRRTPAVTVSEENI